MKELIATIKTAWQAKLDGAKASFIASNDEWMRAIDLAIDMLDSGSLRVASKLNNVWQVNTWCKHAILLALYAYKNKLIDSGIVNLEGHSAWYDKISSKFANWNAEKFEQAGFRALPGSIVRHGAFIGKSAVLMPSFVNIGAYVDEGSMIDAWSTIGSCAQIGKNCHISGGVGIGGVLEPLQNMPVIIEDNCFIGARSEIAEGVIIGEGSVISMGVYIGSSTKIFNRMSGKITYGSIPPMSVVVPGTISDSNSAASLYCAIIVKNVDSKTRSKTEINEILRP